MPSNFSRSSHNPRGFQELAQPTPPTKAIPPRYPFYGLLLIATVWLVLSAPIVALADGDSRSISAVATGAGIFSAVICIFVTFLIGHGTSDPHEQRPHLLSRCYIHVSAFTFITLAWLVLGIYFTIETKYECEHEAHRCKPAIILTILAFLISLFAFLSAAVVTCAVYASGLPWPTHVEKARSSAAYGRDDIEATPPGPSLSLQPIPIPPRAALQRNEW